MDAAKARGHIGRNEANPARWRGHLDKLLPKRAKLTRGHHAAMPYGEVPAFVGALRERPAMAARALEFCILTAARSGEALAARWDEIDFEAEVWTVPAERTKAAREHRVPAVRARPRNFAGNGSRADGRLPFFPASGPAVRCPAWRSKCCSAHGVALHGARLPLAVPRLGGQRDALSRANSPSTRWRTSSATRPNKPIADATRSRGGAS